MMITAAVEAAHVHPGSVVSVADQGRIGGDMSVVAEAGGTNTLAIEVNGKGLQIVPPDKGLSAAAGRTLAALAPELTGLAAPSSPFDAPILAINSL